MAATTEARSPAMSCWLAVAPAMTLAAVITPATVPCCCGHAGARPVGSGLVAVWHRKMTMLPFHAQLADMDVRLRQGSLQPAIRLRILDDLSVWGDRGGELPPCQSWTPRATPRSRSTARRFDRPLATVAIAKRH